MTVFTVVSQCASSSKTATYCFCPLLGLKYFCIASLAIISKSSLLLPFSFCCARFRSRSSAIVFSDLTTWTFVSFRILPVAISRTVKEPVCHSSSKRKHLLPKPLRYICSAVNACHRWAAILYFFIAVSRPFPSLCTRSGTASYLPGESFPNSIASCKGGDWSNGLKFIFIHDEWAGVEPMLADNFGDEQSNRSRFGPGVRWTSALKWEFWMGHEVCGKLSWWWQTVSVPSTECAAGSPISP